MTAPRWSSGVSMVTRSTGSYFLPSIDLHDHFRLADRELEALASHRLDEHRELQLAAGLDLPGVGALGGVDADADVADQLGLEPVLDQAGGELGALAAGERRRVDADRHGERRLVDGDDGQRSRVVGVGEGLADRDLVDAGDGDEIAGAGLVDGHAGELLGEEQLGDLHALDRPVGAAPRGLLALAHGAFHDAAQCEAADVLVGVEVGHPGLQRRALGVGGRRDGGQHHVAQRGEVGALHVRLERCPTLAARAVHDREVELRVAGIEVDEQLVDLVDDLGDAGVGTVDLVDHEDHGHVVRERLAEHEAGLRQRALGGVDQEDDAVDHGERPLDLATEVGVAGRVDDVERDAAPDHRGVLGEDGDALLTLEVVRVHDAVGDRLVGAEGARLAQQGVDQRGLAVVDVGDDREVA